MTEGWDVLDELQFLFNKSISSECKRQVRAIGMFTHMCAVHGMHWELSDKTPDYEYAVILNHTIIITDTRTNK